MTSETQQKHEVWLQKTLTSHTEKLKHISEKLTQIKYELREQNGRVRELEIQNGKIKGAGIFLSCLFTLLTIIITLNK